MPMRERCGSHMNSLHVEIENQRNLFFTRYISRYAILVVPIDENELDWLSICTKGLFCNKTIQVGYMFFSFATKSSRANHKTQVIYGWVFQFPPV